MYRILNQLYFYRDTKPDGILAGLADIFYKFEHDTSSHELLTAALYQQTGRIFELAVQYGLCGNLWHQLIVWHIVMSENPFSLACERALPPTELSDLARADLKRLAGLMNFDFSRIEDELGINCFSSLTGFGYASSISSGTNNQVQTSADPAGSLDQYKVIGKRISILTEALAFTSRADEFFDSVVSFYQKYGCGLIGLGSGFRLEGLGDEVSVLPVNRLPLVQFEDLIGYQSQKLRLMDNTEAFLRGRRANNLLLHGDSGTGKSTCIRALVNQYTDNGLRVIEIYKHQLPNLAWLITQLSARNYRFILYMDDLSFEDFETDFKHLKSVIEGGLGAQPDNILIYATSNRRHLIRETWSDRSDAGRSNSDDIHHSDTAEEKISLVNRFGVTIYFPRPDQQQYLEIVRGLAAQYPQLHIPEDTLLEEARRWGINFGNISGRRARQFINYLIGQSEHNK
jgi:hypothetical protein